MVCCGQGELMPGIQYKRACLTVKVEMYIIISKIHERHKKNQHPFTKILSENLKQKNSWAFFFFFF